MTYVVSSYFSPSTPCGSSTDAKALDGALTVPNCQDSGMKDKDGFLTLKEQVQFRGWTEIAECDACTATGLVESEPSEDQKWLYRPSVGETAGPHYTEWLRWYLSDKDCLLCKKQCQFWWRGCVERG